MENKKSVSVVVALAGAMSLPGAAATADSARVLPRCRSAITLGFANDQVAWRAGGRIIS